MNKPKGGKKHNYLLVGYVKCKKCGANYIGSSSAPYENYVYRFYTCSRHNRKKCDAKIINADMLEATVIDFIKETFFNEASLNEYINKGLELLNDKSDNEERISTLKKEIQACDKKLDNILDIYLDEGMSKEKYMARKNKIEDKMKYLQSELEYLTTADEVLTKKDVKKAINYLLKNIDDSYEYKKMMVDTFLDYIIIDDETFEISLIYNLFRKSCNFICNDDSTSPYSSKKAFTASPPLQID